jgi:uncharacterized membrane protein YjgN (DUF898 family)
MVDTNYYVYQMPKRKRYGFLKFIVDVLLTCITGGFWLIWIFVREMRKAR